MTVLGLRMAASSNGVSKLHGKLLITRRGEVAERLKAAVC